MAAARARGESATPTGDTDASCALRADLVSVAPFVACARFSDAALLLAQLTRHLRVEEQTWRALALVPLPRVHARTLLMHAARAGDLGRVVFLLEHGHGVRVNAVAPGYPQPAARAPQPCG